MGKKREIIKAVAGFSVSIGASMIVGSYVRLAIPADVRLVPKILMVAGGYGIGGYVGEKAAEHVLEQIDIIGEGVDNLKALIKGVEVENATFNVTVQAPGAENVTPIKTDDK